MLFFLIASADAQTKLLRFPDLYGDQVAFCYAGDIWTAPASGGLARRLTAHPGQELFPKYSPDGKWIAFTGQYDGDEQVYVVPSTGGVPKRLTYYPGRGPLPPRWGYDHQVYGWTPDGRGVLFRSLRDGFDLGDNRLYTVSIDGGLPEALPMPRAGAGDISPDGKRVAYSPLFRDFRSWKRYQGGWAQDLQIFDLASHAVTPVTEDPRSDRDPMWIGDKIFFASDRDGTLNIYSYDIGSKRVRQVTRGHQWDVRWPSRAEDARIVYELGGELQILNADSGRSRKIDILVPDDGLSMRPAHISAAAQIEDAALSPKGERVLFAARGDIFTAPIEHGPTRNLTHSSDAHDRAPDWSPDGRRILYISDSDGEEELYLIDQDGKGGPEQLTDGHNARLYAPLWSPDGKRIAFSDKEGRIFVLRLSDKHIDQIADDRRGQSTDYSWSPNGGHLALSLSEPNGFNSIWIWSADQPEAQRVTSEMFNEFSPVWDSEGKYLYYLSDRQFAPQLGSFEWNYMVDRETGIYALALRKDVPHPFPARSDEVTVEEDEKEMESNEPEAASEQPEGAASGEEGEQEDKKEDAKSYIQIDFDGLAQRVARVPVADDNYAGLAAVPGHLLYVRTGPGYYGRASDIRPSLRIFSMEDREETTLAEAISSSALSQDGSKVLVQSRGRWQLMDAKPSGKNSPKEISTDGLRMDSVPAQEWAEIFREVWRRYRDYFYVANMHGYDWEALRRQYEPLVRYVAHRSDLNYILTEMVAELSVSHAYITGGDFDIPDRPSYGLPGARFELDKQSGRYRIAKILRGQNEEPVYRSPLTEVGVDLQEGAYVLAIDGQPLNASDNPYEFLMDKGDHPVTLTVNDTPSMEGSREVSYDPVESETDLIYFNWVENNRRKVDEATAGRIGYMHIPDMGAAGIREFIKSFYGQIRKDGFIVDVRGNGGGNVSEMIIERLSRKLLSLGFPRTSDYTDTYPNTVFAGPMVCLLNETSASDGDIFPAMFKRAGLGPLIGKRSWGGVTGISGHGPLIDGGGVNVPEFGFADSEGHWSIEGHGVDPDIVVENDPESIIEGRDPQLEKAIEIVMEKVKEGPGPLPGRPQPPVKTP